MEKEGQEMPFLGGSVLLEVELPEKGGKEGNQVFLFLKAN